MKPTLQEFPPRAFVGLEGRFLGALSPDCNNHKVIPPLFHRFFARAAELPAGLDAFTYGLTRCAPERDRSREDELVYLVARLVAPYAHVPEGMAKWNLPAATCAVFTHRGPIVRVEETFARIYREWFPSSGFEPVGEGSIECYDDARFGDGGANSELDILIPVRPIRR